MVERDSLMTSVGYQAYGVSVRVSVTHFIAVLVIFGG